MYNMYVKKAAEKTFVRKIREYNADEIDTDSTALVSCERSFWVGCVRSKILRPNFKEAIRHKLRLTAKSWELFHQSLGLQEKGPK